MSTSKKSRMAGFGPLEWEEAMRLINLALAEDLPGPDVTSESLIPPDARIRGALVPRQEGVLCGGPVIVALFETLDRRVSVQALRGEGDRVNAGEQVLEISGPALPVLSGERTALNFIQRLSGIASMVRRWMDALGDSAAVLLDTRKTTPGWRYLEKYAVRTGGAANHRFHLSDQALVKDNHIEILRALGAGGVREWVAAIRARDPRISVEVEVEDLEEFRDAVDAGADIVLLDNMPPEAMRQAARELRERGGRRPLLEASGGIDARTLREVAATGVDRISAGALTHSAVAMDIGFDLLEVHRDEVGA